MRISKTPQRKCHIDVVVTNVLLEDRKRALEEPARIACIAIVNVHLTEVHERMAHYRAVGTVRPLEDHERAFQHISRLGVVA